MKNPRPLFFAFFAAASLTGCAIPKEDLPAGWVVADRVLFSSADRIKIEWDNWQTNEAAVRAKAALHCGDREIEEIDAHQDPSTFGVLRSKTWRCVPAEAPATSKR